MRPDGQTVLGAGRKHVPIGVLFCSSTPGLDNGGTVKPFFVKYFIVVLWCFSSEPLEGSVRLDLQYCSFWLAEIFF